MVPAEARKFTRIIWSEAHEESDTFIYRTSPSWWSDCLLAKTRVPAMVRWSESSWMQKNIDSVDLESGKGCLIPILVCNFFRFSKNNLVSERKKKQNRGMGNHISLHYSTLYYFVGFPYHRSGSWNLSGRENNAQQKLRGISVVEVRVSFFCILVENCHIRLHSGLKNPYPCMFL